MIKITESSEQFTDFHRPLCVVVKSSEILLMTLETVSHQHQCIHPVLILNLTWMGSVLRLTAMIIMSVALMTLLGALKPHWQRCKWEHTFPR